jgi:hypothetical protein
VDLKAMKRLDAVDSDKKRFELTREKIVFLDLLMLLLAFFAVNYLKRGSLKLTCEYFDLLVVFSACWMLASLVGKKFRTMSYRDFKTGLRTLFLSNCYLGYCISFVIVFFGMEMYSRIQVFGTCLMLLALNMAVWFLGHRKLAGAGGSDGETLSLNYDVSPEQYPVHYRLLVSDLILLIVSFWVVNWLKRGHLGLPPEYSKLLLITIALWFFTSLATRKFVTGAFKNGYDAFWQWQKAGVIMLSGMAVLVFAFRLFYYSRFQAFGTVLLLMILECVLLVIVFGNRAKSHQSRDVESAEQVGRILDQEPVDTDIDIESIRRQLMAPAKEKLKKQLEAVDWNIFSFLEEHVPLEEILWLETEVSQSCELVFRQPHMTDVPLRLFINLQKLNDVRRLNQYFLNLYQRMLAGAYFVGYAHTIRTHHEWVYGKFPRLMAHIIYTADFAINRVMPKLPGIKQFYFMLTKGKNRIISRAELLGRLSFCGFEIVAQKDFEKRFWVIARKVKKPSFNNNPTYGPLVTLERYGYQEEIIKVHKMRTMHPYSEFLQDYVFAEQGLEEGGKLKDDFRVTSWGRWFRKLWIDELPMLYNWLKGDLKIVGVRPLSRHYLSLYDKDLRQMRLQTKPGLIPPFYVDLPKTFEEICESEKKYLQAFLKNPIKTDIYYGIVALYNIFVKKARSN